MAEVLTALGSILTPILSLIGVILMIRANQKIAKVEHATNSMKDELVASALAKGERKGVEAGERDARVRAEGQREGVEIARAGAQASMPILGPSETPVPVTDDRVAVATETLAQVAVDTAAKQDRDENR